MWRPVDERVVLGNGVNRLEIIPIRGEGAERMLFVWLPEHRLLYAADLVQRQQDGGFWWPEYLVEVVHAVERTGLSPDQVWAMHSDPLAFEELRAAVAEVRAPGAAH